MRKIIIGSLVFFSITAFPQTSQWRGANRDGQYSDSGLLQSWPEGGPELLLTVEGIGRGFSSALLHDGIIYVTGMSDSMDYLSAIDLNGNIKWRIPYGSAWHESNPDSRCTPTIDGNFIYLISGQGEVVCLDLTTSGKIWSVDAFNKFEGRHGEWGIAESPLLVNDKVIYTPGGVKTTMVAFDRKNGEIVWMTESLKDTTAYVSPILINYAGYQIIVGVTARYIFGVDAQDGTILWKYKYYDLERPLWHPWAPVINCISPLYHDGQVYVTSGYNHVGVLLNLSGDGSNVNFAWKDSTLDCHHGGVVHVDRYIYGSNWINNSTGNWCCVEWETGKTMYNKEWMCKGSIITAENMLYCYDEKRGNVALVEATPEDFKIISSFRITQGRGPHWAHPTIFDGKLFIRHGDVLMVYDIKEKDD